MEQLLAPASTHGTGSTSGLFAGHYPKNRIIECLIDVAAVSAAWEATIHLRIFLNRLMELQLDRETLLTIAPPLPLVLGLWVIAAFWLHVYREAPPPRRASSLLRVMESGTICGAVITVAAFFSREMGADLSRSFVLLFTPVCYITLGVFRLTGILAYSLAEPYWPVKERVAVVAERSHGEAVMERIRSFGPSRAAGLIVPGDDLRDEAVAGVLGTTARLAELINTARIDRIIVMEQRLSDQELQHCYAVSKRMGVTVTRIIGIQQDARARPRISEEFGLQLLEMNPVSFTRVQELAKRSFDLVCSAFALLLLSPLFLAVALLVKTTSKGGVFYCSRRVGKGGRHFTFLKFRTMYTGSDDRRWLMSKNEKSGHIFKMRVDPRLTRVGRLLRRWSIDELPQLINVLLGNMSMVGPRPLPATDLDPDGQSREFQVWAEQRSRVLPGITGLWQIRGRSDLPFDKMVEFDVQYIREWSLALDLKILLETPLVVFTGRGAY